MDERRINNGGKLIDYFCDYIERHFDEITDEITLREEFDLMWPVTQDYINYGEYEIGDKEAFNMFKHAYGLVNDDKRQEQLPSESDVRDIVAESLKRYMRRMKK